jgi:hypothetical protein
MHKKKKKLPEMLLFCLTNGSIYGHACDLNREHVHERASFHHAHGRVHAYHRCDSTLFVHLLLCFLGTSKPARSNMQFNYKIVSISELWLFVATIGNQSH